MQRQQQEKEVHSSFMTGRSRKGNLYNNGARIYGSRLSASLRGSVVSLLTRLQ